MLPLIVGFPYIREEFSDPRRRQPTLKMVHEKYYLHRTIQRNRKESYCEIITNPISCIEGIFKCYNDQISTISSLIVKVLVQTKIHKREFSSTFSFIFYARVSKKKKNSKRLQIAAGS